MNKYKKCFVLQHDEKDCGCACLKMVTRCFGGDVNLEYLKELSGTTSKGTSMLGLIQASQQLGISAVGYEASINDLKDINNPCILHVEASFGYHYIVCFSYKKNKFIVGDPAYGIRKYDEVELLNIWKKGYLLSFEKSNDFKSKKVKENIHVKWLLSVIAEDSSFYVTAVFLGLLIAFLSMATLVFTEKLVDVILPSRDKSLLLKSLAAWSFLLMLVTGLNYIRSIILIRQAYRFNTRIIKYFFNKLLLMPKVFFDSKRKGDMISRMNDTERLQRNIKKIIADSFIELAMILMSFAFLAYYSLDVALLVSISFPVLYFITYAFNDIIKKLQHKMFSSYALTESNYIDTVSGIEAIKSYNKEDFFSQKNINIYSTFQGYIARLQQSAINQSTITNFSGSIISIGAIIYSIVLVYYHNIEIGDLIAIISLVLLFVDSIHSIVVLNFDIFESKIALERMFDFVERSEEADQDRKSNKVQLKNIHNITFESVYFSYPGQNYLIENITLSLTKGSITFLTGKSGSGKSTIMQLLLHFYQPTSGKIILNKKVNLKNVFVDFWRKQVAYVPQHVKIFNTDLITNISIDDDIDKENVIMFCKKLGFNKYFEKFQEGYETILGEEGINVSGGEKQLIALARALYSKPKILLLDEVSASLDSETEKFVLELLMAQKNNLITLFITHKEELVKNVADKVYFLQNKTIVENQ